MILTSESIISHRLRKKIIIEPFNENQLGTISYKFRVDNCIACLSHSLDSRFPERLNFEEIPETGYLLKPDELYLVSTYEVLGSSLFAMQIFAIRSVGSLGIFIDVSANLGHVGSVCKWTLELVAVQPVLIFPRQIIGQIIFWSLLGPADQYSGDYQAMSFPMPSKLWKEMRNKNEI